MIDAELALAPHDEPALRVLHVFNRHRHGGGSDNAWDATIRLSREAGLDVRVFERDSRDLPAGVRGRVRAFADGLYPRRTLAALDAAIARHSPDVINTHELYPLITPFALARAARSGVPVVHTLYDFRMSCPIATHGRSGKVCTECVDHGEHRAFTNNCRGNHAESAAFALRSTLARRFDLYRRHVSHFIVLSPFARDWLIAHHGIAPDRITIGNCAITAPERSVADPAAGGYIAFAGRPVPEKGMAVLAAAARIARLPVRIAVPAGAPLPADLGDHIDVIATRGPDELAAFYRGARMLVVPSLWFETFAIVAGEAMGHGVPVIASDIGALANTVVRDETGLLVPPGDAAALASAMRRLWDDAALTRRLGANARERTTREFSGATHLARVRSAYAKALTCPPPA